MGGFRGFSGFKLPKLICLCVKSLKINKITPKINGSPQIKPPPEIFYDYALEPTRQRPFQ